VSSTSLAGVQRDSCGGRPRGWADGVPEACLRDPDLARKRAVVLMAGAVAERSFGGRNNRSRVAIHEAGHWAVAHHLGLRPGWLEVIGTDEAAAGACGLSMAGPCSDEPRAGSGPLSWPTVKDSDIWRLRQMIRALGWASDCQSTLKVARELLNEARELVIAQRRLISWLSEALLTTGLLKGHQTRNEMYFGMAQYAAHDFAGAAGR
jgi:hypothetical protein